ncbi:flavodoxin family protein [uncultured Desulfovibrio sp.]|uniref:flavodoxin family protein n=1 Tax=uncultured Desulfovibrio sp. TaxID=167968 RepID=UPI002621C5BD|nr:flavodoxin family protein [uncultured Desulfovibrio sp.]
MTEAPCGPSCLAAPALPPEAGPQPSRPFVRQLAPDGLSPRRDGPLRIGIVYSSLSGNTRQVAQALAGQEFPLHQLAEAPCPDNFDLLALGFWVRRGLPDERSQRYWEGIRGKDIFLFGTLGAWPHSPHAQRCLAAARECLLANGNRILGEFLCLGRVNPHALAASARKGTHPMTATRAARLAEAARHPCAGDFAAARACWQQTLDILAGTGRTS